MYLLILVIHYFSAQKKQIKTNYLTRILIRKGAETKPTSLTTYLGFNIIWNPLSWSLVFKLTSCTILLAIVGEEVASTIETEQEIHN